MKLGNGALDRLLCIVIHRGGGEGLKQFENGDEVYEQEKGGDVLIYSSHSETGWRSDVLKGERASVK